MLTFLDWENYLDDSGNARPLNWSLGAMRGASVYPYAMAIHQAARMRGFPFSSALPDVRAGQVEIANNVNYAVASIGFALDVARRAILQTTISLDKGADGYQWVDPAADMAVGTVQPAATLFPPLAGGSVATPEEKQLIMDLTDGMAKPYRSVMGKFGGMAAALLACKHVLQTMTRRVVNPYWMPTAGGITTEYRSAGQGTTIEDAKADFLDWPPTAIEGDVGENYSYEFRGQRWLGGDDYVINGHGLRYSGHFPEGMSEIFNPQHVPYALGICRLIQGPGYPGQSVVFSCAAYDLPAGEPPFVYVDQISPVAPSHTWTQNLGFRETFPDHPFPEMIDDGRMYGYSEMHIHVFDYAFPL